MTPRPKNISIRDVAELAGVSLGSASRVVNKAANVSEATRQKVEAAIAQLGYRPNYAAQALRSRSTRTIGCLFTNVGNPLYAQVFRAMEERLLAEGYMLVLANGLNDPEREVALLDMFKSRGMDGLLIAPGNEGDARVRAAVESLDLPVVVLDRDLGPTHHDAVLFEHEPAMAQAVSQLAALGHRRIALVLAQAPNRPMRLRVQGYDAALAAQGLTREPGWLVRLPSSTASAFEPVTRLMATKPRPTALIVQGSTILSGSLHALHMAGLRIPQDVSVLSLGDPDYARHHVPPISALRMDLDRAAAEATRLLMARIRGEDEGAPVQVSVPADWITRDSCAAPPADR
jgi:LacI family transcriptional regulator